jgi:ComF family protein
MWCKKILDVGMLQTVQWVGQTFLDAIFPRTCFICGTPDSFDPLERNKSLCAVEQIVTPYFCASCCKNIHTIDSPLCVQCGLPFISRHGQDHLCGDCIENKKYFRMARASGVYDGTLLEAIHLFKYGKKRCLARPLGMLLQDTFFRFWDTQWIDLIVPVPLHIERLRKRGFNQPLLLFSRWATTEKIPYNPHVLKRPKRTVPQTNLSKKERKKNIRGAFQVMSPAAIKGKRIVLVDDVYTTGFTANECARILMKGGAAVVDVLTLARTVEK